MGRSPQSCGCQHGRVQRLIVNGRHHARGPRPLFPMQGSFSFIKTSRKNAAYRVKVEKDRVPPALALQPIVQRDGLVIIRAGMTQKDARHGNPPELLR